MVEVFYGHRECCEVSHLKYVACSVLYTSRGCRLYLRSQTFVPCQRSCHLLVKGQVNYTAVSGNGLPLFQVNPGTGDVTTSGRVNREVRGRYTLVVRATDGGVPALSSSCLVDITVNDLNDNAPIFSPADFVVNLSEGATVGTSVTSVAATDADASASNNVFSYVLTDNVFQVNVTTGVVSTKRTLDRETTSQ